MCRDLRNVSLALMTGSALLLASVAPSSFDPFGSQPAFARGNGGGGGGSHGNSGGSGGNSGNHGNSNSSSGGSNSHASTAPGQNKSGGNSASGNGNSGDGAVDTAGITTPSTTNGKSGKEKNVRAQAGGLNSLLRDPTALLKSKDKRLLALVQYASDLATTQYDLEQAVAKAQATLTQALADQTTAETDYYNTLSDALTAMNATLTSYDSSYDYSNPTNTTLDALNQHLQDLTDNPITDTSDPNYDAYMAEVGLLTSLTGDTTLQDAATAWDTANTDVSTAQTDLNSAQTTYSTAASTDFQIDGTSTSLDSLDAAILAGANPNFATKYGTPTDELVQWVENALGVGSSTGVVDTIYGDLSSSP